MKNRVRVIILVILMLSTGIANANTVTFKDNVSGGEWINNPNTYTESGMIIAPNVVGDSMYVGEWTNSHDNVVDYYYYLHFHENYDEIKFSMADNSTFTLQSIEVIQNGWYSNSTQPYILTSEGETYNLPRTWFDNPVPHLTFSGSGFEDIQWFKIFSFDNDCTAIDNIVFESSGVISAPEPTTMLLLSLGLVGLAGVRRKFKN